jgi:hypothetical protein
VSKVGSGGLSWGMCPAGYPGVMCPGVMSPGVMCPRVMCPGVIFPRNMSRGNMSRWDIIMWDVSSGYLSRGDVYGEMCQGKCVKGLCMSLSSYGVLARCKTSAGCLSTRSGGMGKWVRDTIGKNVFFCVKHCLRVCPTGVAGVLMSLVCK